jgi:adenylate cyclase class 2
VLEVEAKLELLAPGSLRDALRGAGAEKEGTEVQTDTYYRHPVRDFAATDEALRVRRTEAGWELTYKGPKRGGDVKARTEHNVAAAHDPDPVLQALGFRVFATVAKTREVWMLDGVSVAIDDVEGLGAFVEVEVVGEDQAAATARVEETVARLGLEGATRFQASYLEMALAAGVVQAQE